MAIRKTVEEAFVVAGARDEVLRRCEHVLSAQGFTHVNSNSVLFQVEGKLHKFALWGEIVLALLPEGANTKIVAKATANVDNVFALFRSPSMKILQAFKSGFC